MIELQEEKIEQNNQDITNPEIDEQYRCRICYETFKPLVKICNCSGSIAYVHEKCILDWIARKMQFLERIQIPQCQICHNYYSAVAQIGQKKICYHRMLNELKSYGIIRLFILLITIIIGLGSLLLLIRYGCFIIWLFFQDQHTIIIHNDSFRYEADFGQILIICFVFPLHVGIESYKRLKITKNQIMKQSIIQIVEVTLQPEEIIKN